MLRIQGLRCSSRTPKVNRQIVSVMSRDLKIIHGMLKKTPQVHLVNGMNVRDELLNTKVLYVFKDPSLNGDGLVTVTQGVLASISQNTLESLKQHLDLDFTVHGISKGDFELCLMDHDSNGIVIYNAYSSLRDKCSYYLYYEVPQPTL